jgi:hypothetical protein
MESSAASDVYKRQGREWTNEAEEEFLRLMLP